LQDLDNPAVNLTAEIVAAYVSNNPVPASQLPELITEVHRSLQTLSSPPAAEEPEPRKPAVPVKKSVSHDHVTCLEDGLQFKSLKRHLAAVHGMTPDEYRLKWGLRPDYPMVAPAYSSERSKLAMSMGLGRKDGKAARKGKKGQSARPAAVARPAAAKAKAR